MHVPALLQSPTRFTSIGTIPPEDIATRGTAEVDVYIANGGEDAVGADAAGIRSFVSAGGGLVLGTQANNWGQDLAQHPGNLVLQPMGIVLSGLSSEGNVAVGAVRSPPAQQANADVALACLDVSCKGTSIAPCYTDNATEIAALKATCGAVALYIADGAAGSTFRTKLKQVGSVSRLGAEGQVLGSWWCLEVSRRGARCWVDAVRHCAALCAGAHAQHSVAALPGATRNLLLPFILLQQPSQLPPLPALPCDAL